MALSTAHAKISALSQQLMAARDQLAVATDAKVTRSPLMAQASFTFDSASSIGPTLHSGVSWPILRLSARLMRGNQIALRISSLTLV